MLDAKFDWIAVSFTASGSGTPFGERDRIGARVRVGVKMANDVREIDVPVLLDKACSRTLGELRDEAVTEATKLLRLIVEDLDGQTFDSLAARQDRQDEERDREFQDSLHSDISKAINPTDGEDRA